MVVRRLRQRFRRAAAHVQPTSRLPANTRLARFMAASVPGLAPSAGFVTDCLCWSRRSSGEARYRLRQARAQLQDRSTAATSLAACVPRARASFSIMPRVGDLARLASHVATGWRLAAAARRRLPKAPRQPLREASCLPAEVVAPQWRRVCKLDSPFGIGAPGAGEVVSPFASVSFGAEPDGYPNFAPDIGKQLGRLTAGGCPALD